MAYATIIFATSISRKKEAILSFSPLNACYNFSPHGRSQEKAPLAAAFLAARMDMVNEIGTRSDHCAWGFPEKRRIPWWVRCGWSPQVGMLMSK